MIEPLKASGAKSTITDDLARACNLFDHFKADSIKDFADFLDRATLFDKGELQRLAQEVRAKPGRAPRTPKPKAPKLTADEALRSIRGLYERSTAEDISFESIHDGVWQLEPLTKPNLETVAREFGIEGKFKAKKDALEAIEKKIAGRRSGHQQLEPIYR